MAKFKLIDNLGELYMGGFYNEFCSNVLWVCEMKFEGVINQLNDFKEDPVQWI
jgi:hypothetical protein